MRSRCRRRSTGASCSRRSRTGSRRSSSNKSPSRRRSRRCRRSTCRRSASSRSGLSLRRRGRAAGASARPLFRTLIFLPAVVPIIVVPILWQFLFNPYGLVNDALKTVGLPPMNWLLSARGAVAALVLATAWRLTPLCMVIYLAGLQSIPAELYDAGKVDGAGVARRFRSITLPLLKPTFLVVVVFAITLTVQNFVLALVMTGGGPDSASTTLSLFVYQTGFLGFRMGYASAAAIVMLLIIVVFTMINLRVFRTDE